MGWLVFCLFCRVWKKCRCTGALLSSRSSQTLLLAGCGGNLLQWFPILCWLKTKGCFPLPSAFASLPFLCQRGWWEPSVLNVLHVGPHVWMDAPSCAWTACDLCWNWIFWALPRVLELLGSMVIHNPPVSPPISALCMCLASAGGESCSYLCWWLCSKPSLDTRGSEKVE